MTIIRYDHPIRHQFETMLVEYFAELCDDLPSNIVRGKILNLLLRQQEQGIVHIAIASENDTPIGFSIYQIDTRESDWCKFPGWGCIREFYIVKQYRRKGYGSKLAAWSEKQLRLLGTEQFYLTSDDAISFWEQCGYHNTQEICSNDLEILAK